MQKCKQAILTRSWQASQHFSLDSSTLSTTWEEGISFKFKYISNQIFTLVANWSRFSCRRTALVVPRKSRSRMVIEFRVFILRAWQAQPLHLEVCEQMTQCEQISLSNVFHPWMWQDLSNLVGEYLCTKSWIFLLPFIKEPRLYKVLVLWLLFSFLWQGIKIALPCNVQWTVLKVW